MNPQTRRRLRRLLIVTAAVLLAVELVYLVGANWYLNSGRLFPLINRKPEKFALRWGTAWTLWPGAVHLRDVEMRGRSRRIDWYAHLEAVGASCRLLPLSDRIVHLRHVSASGIDYRQRGRSEDEQPGAAPDPASPPLPDFAIEGPPGPPKAKKPPGAPWTIIADDIDTDVKQLWFDRYRLSGRMTVDTSMRLVVRGPLEFPRVRFRMTEGDLLEGEQAILETLRIDVETALPAFVPKGVKAPDVVRLLSGRFQLEADRARLLFLESYLAKAPWLKFNGNSTLKADLRLANGRLGPGSTLASEFKEVNVDFLDRNLRGAGRMSWVVEEAEGAPLSRLQFVLDEFALAVPGEAVPYARGEGFRVAASSPSLDLEDPFARLTVAADLEKAAIPDLSTYNRYIPSGTALAIRNGAGSISYHIESAEQEGSLRGWIKLSADDLVAQFENYEIRGDLEIDTQLKEIQAKEGRFDISGTKVALSSNKFRWTADISFPEATLRFAEPLEVRAGVAIRMTDTTPLVAMFDARKDISKFVERLMTIKDIEGKASLVVDARGTEIADVAFTGEDLQVLADLALHKGGKDGILYIKYHIFSVGVAFDQGKKDLDLVRARKWFERERAQRRGLRGADRR